MRRTPVARKRDRSGTAASPARPRGAPWRPTEIQRSYRDLLDSAKQEPQTIQDADGSLLVVETKEQADFEHRIARHLAEAAQFQAAYTAHAKQDPLSWAAETPYPWLAGLSREEIAEFARELLAYALDAAQRRTVESLEGNLKAWQSTAEVYEQPEVLAQLIAPIDAAEIVEVFPPSEEAVAEAAGDAA